MKKIFLALFTIGLFTTGCTDKFDEINENPNAPEDVRPQFLLANVISVAADKNTFDQGFRLANYLEHFAASVEFERIDRYEMGSNSTYWNTLYHLQTDIRSIKENENSNEAYVAVCDIMSSFMYSQLTDMWGNVPYSEAIGAIDGNITPKYDTQQFIYTDPDLGILAVLQNAAMTLNETSATIDGDVMFGNDLDQWIRFANSLRVRYLLRISGRVDVSGQLQTLVSEDRLMRGNMDNAVVPYLSSAPNQWPMFNSSLGLYQEHRMTTTVDSILSAWEDPRVDVLYKPTSNSVLEGNPVFNGILNGQSRETIAASGIDLSDVSLFGAIFRDVPGGVDGQFMQYAELQFALAEACERGILGGDALTYYQNGISASFEYYNTSLPGDYFTRENVALDGTNNLTKIMTQKWLSLISNGHEAWFNIRRTGIPALVAGPDNLNNGMYPVRYLYPEGEQATNAANYAEAAGAMGGDDINSKGWWEQ
ncbi:SusD/RagB family nutrient-binding outer membrane lipoprotein [Cryomorpha ignava]|uniref:SusD/RagB family nutrient-binding outer membrane lipoprotein n=1 Tax=Cryomorpha ignava TaxID=101383 RepID=A0A7K3WPR4_9FLAO|nr:SusD/RagB family nutrient-binding outer membrane lipoprotein [Cryomorpha ignava]NEN23536.1 SusD/RagB family nutrient-binding outer membrane lipoprotein [Cryomorpha ignava]